MKEIALDKCDGLKNIRGAYSGEPPIIEPGMNVVLCQGKIEIKVEVGPKFTGQEQTNFIGKVIAEVKNTTPSLASGDIIPFSRENICYITQKI